MAGLNGSQILDSYWYIPCDYNENNGRKKKCWKYSKKAQERIDKGLVPDDRD